ncbi:PIN domain-containing protein [Synechococcus sp. PCC 7336]|uniref:type II toxin-antitoxin system VapC family toxin n=1 Tax=Synechococcus sp. PCC 7336 TaxID=195250 RepID=UPI000344A498|nr:PIN domain-containing protein [Synechococcus sp. PCC 7336]
MYLVDTNVLLRAQQPQQRQFTAANNAVKTLEQQGYELGIVPQVAAEFWNVCTRPLQQNGLGLTSAVTARKLQAIENAFTVFTGSERDIYRQWRRLVVSYSVKGIQVHDTRLVAAMLVHGLTHILTFNVEDFERFAEITVFHPEAIPNP